MLTTALTVTGLYIVTQSYQTGEDRARGDRTLPVMLGPRRALYVAVAVLAAGGAVMVLSVGARFGWGWSAVLGLFFAAVGTGLLRWAGRFEESEVTRNFYTAMRVAAVSSGVLSAFFLYHLV
jgi:4-hydroxybenzoate polyprenyltransferase